MAREAFQRVTFHHEPEGSERESHKGQRLEKSILAEGRAAKAEARGRSACCVLERTKRPAWLECGKGEGLAVRPKAGPGQEALCAI